MTSAELTHYLHAHIPLSRAMQVEVLGTDPDQVVLRAPLAPNINHRDTLFGGSASAVSILAAWSLLHVRLRAAGLASRVVIQRNSMDYEQPVAGDFTVRATLADVAQWTPFLRTLQRRGRARIAVTAVIDYEGHEAGRLRGEFVAFGP